MLDDAKSVLLLMIFVVNRNDDDYHGGDVDFDVLLSNRCHLKDSVHPVCDNCWSRKVAFHLCCHPHQLVNLENMSLISKTFVNV